MYARFAILSFLILTLHSAEFTLNEFSRDYAVFDSGAQLGADVAHIPLSGQAAAADGTKVEVRAVHAENNEKGEWQHIAVVKNKKWQGKLALKRSVNWYRIEARIAGQDETMFSNKNRCAAGHVWAIYEQSNWAQMMMRNSSIPKAAAIKYPNDVQVFVFRKGDEPVARFVLSDENSYNGVMGSIANALSAERPGEKFAIAFHTKSGTSPGDMLTTQEEDPKGKRDWNREVALHESITADGSPVGLVTINGWIAFGGGRARVASIFTKLFLGKELDGTPISAGQRAGADRIATFYDWSYSRLAWIGPHARDNKGKLAEEVKTLADLPGYRNKGDLEYNKLVALINEHFGSDHLPETLPFQMQTIGGLRGRPSKKIPWTECNHHSRTDRDGSERLARLGMAATLKTLGLVEWPVPQFNRRHNAEDGTYIDLWMDGFHINTPRRMRHAVGTLGKYPEEIPKTFPHRTEVMGFDIDGVPAMRAEIIENAGGSGFNGVRLYPNEGTFTEKTMIGYGSGCYPARQIRYEDPMEGIHLNYAVVDVGQKDLSALPIQPQPVIPFTLR